MGNDQFVDFPGEWALLALGLMRAFPLILHVPSGYKRVHLLGRKPEIDARKMDPSFRKSNELTAFTAHNISSL